MADDLASFNKQIGALPIKLKRQLAGAIQVEADRLAAPNKAAATVFPLGSCSSFLRFYRSGWTPDDIQHENNCGQYRKGVPDRRVIVCHQPQETGQRIVPGANHEVMG